MEDDCASSSAFISMSAGGWLEPEKGADWGPCRRILPSEAWVLKDDQHTVQTPYLLQGFWLIREKVKSSEYCESISFIYSYAVI